MTAVMKIMFGTNKEALLTRNELVGLINLVAKLSNSVKWYQEWLKYEDSMNIQKRVEYYGVMVILCIINGFLLRWSFQTKPKHVISKDKKEK